MPINQTHPIRICEQCGKVFQRYETARQRQAKHHFCSRECRALWEQGANNPSWKGGQPGKTSRTCDQCGKSFSRYETARQRNASHHFCCRKCSDEWHRGPNHYNWQRPALNVPFELVLTCEQCGTKYREREVWARHRRHHFCSRECFYQWHRGSNHANWRGGIAAVYEAERKAWEQRAEYIGWRTRALLGHVDCRLCCEASAEPLHVHHILSFKDYPEYRVDDRNALVLCRRCHEWLHSNDGKSKRLELERKLCAELGIMPRESLREQRQLCA